jgi:CheY-like chemotaxis protein
VLGFFPVASLEASSYDMPAPSVQPHKAPPVARNSAKGLALLAGRKLLLADDSVTIQKVIELTFADEGVRVIAFGNGDEALENLQEVAPDVVLADVFMPGKTGYQLCEHIKQNEQLKHIPVMLLVGSFEPFDEAEARRVGADDILTKPFQSIRRLIDRVGALVGGRPPEEQVPTAELPHATEKPDGQDRLDKDELAITTADTQPLPPDWKVALEKNEQPAVTSASTRDEQRMERAAPEIRTEAQFENDSLLDLSYIEPVDVSAGDDFVLDLDVEEAQNGSSAAVTYEAPPQRAAFVEPEISPTASPEMASQYTYEPEQFEATRSYETTPETLPSRQTSDFGRESYATGSYATERDDEVREVMPVTFETPETAITDAQPTAQITSAAQLSPEMIDAIARRAVEMMSDKVVREVAWEVVPELAELLIKRQLEEKASQPK